MKTKILLLAILFFSVKGYNQTWQWTHPEPNGIVSNSMDGYEDDNAHDVQTDASGNVYVLGDFQDSLYLNNIYRTKGNGSYLAKYDSLGNLLWYKLIVPTSGTDDFGGPSINATDLTVNANGVYITGKYTSSLYLNDYDCSTNTGTLVVRSYNIGGFNFNSSGTEIGVFLTKFNSNGSVIWNKTGSDPSFCKNNSPVWPNHIPTNPVITSDNAGNIVCCFLCITTKGSVVINNDIINLRPSDIDVVNPTYLVVAKYNSAGTLQWSNNAGGGSNTLDSNGGAYQGYLNDCSSLVSDKSNNIFFSGDATDSTFFGSQLFRTNAPEATFIAKISSAGLWQFAKELSNAPGVGSGQNPETLAIDTSNNVYTLVQSSGNPQEILGTTVSTGGTNTSYYLVKMKNNGSLTWVKSFGSNFGNTRANSIQFYNNSLYICGAYYSYLYNAQQKLVFSPLYVPWVAGGITTNLFYAAKADLNGNFTWFTSFEDGGSSAFGNAIKAFNGNVYIAGNYQYKITSLGTLSGSFTNPNINTSNIFFGKIKDQYIRIGAVTPPTLCPGSNITIPFTSYGLTFSGSNTFTAELSNASGDFTTPTIIGTTTSTGTGSITATIPTTLPYGSGYIVRIRSSDTLKTGYNYFAYADTDYRITLLCPAPSSGFATTNITATSATLHWNVVDCSKGYRVQYKVKGTGAWTTVLVNTNTGSLNITGLTANTTYLWHVATKCKPSAVVFSSYSASKQFTTAASFAINGFTSDDVSATGNVFKIYPNPTKNTSTVEFSENKTGSYVLRISDLVGKILWKKEGFSSSGKNIFQIDVSHFA